MTVTWDRITVRRVPPDSFIAEARLHANFATGAICKDPFEAFKSAEQAMAPITRAKQARVISTPDLDDLL